MFNLYTFQGSLTQDFRLHFFHNQFPPGPPSFTIEPSQFFFNSQRYLNVKVNHNCQWHKHKRKIFEIFHIFIFSFSYFHILLRCCSVAIYTHKKIFFLMFTLRCKQAVTGDQLSPVLFLPASNTGDKDKVSGIYKKFSWNF
jgi:hypothetical protein